MCKSLLPFTYSRVEKTTSDTEENPGVDSKGETKSQGDVKQVGRVGSCGNRDGGRSLRTSGCGVCDLSTRKGQEQEHEGTDEFTYPCDKVSSDGSRNLLEDGRATMCLKLFGILEVDLLGRHTRQNNVLGRLTVEMSELVLSKGGRGLT